uniref:Retrovirus-related Pol polyprotein from transposon TNT 1-94 n=1 Tax=Cajanus cajan TaxID=3821 RepID=A0A151S964_CAJCA|nr:Retrovirus-related Pol polyprotein from transposon TNT 1-94 [Cajanus cajan]
MATPNSNSTPPVLADHLVNPSNPLFLHSNENPSLVLVMPLLTEHNFHVWSQNMLTTLESKNKEQFIDGSLPSPPASDPFRSTWQHCNKTVMSWLIRSITPSIAQSVLYMDDVVEIWKDLCERFSHGDKFRISDLQASVHECKQGDSTVSQYYTHLKTLWKQLEQYRSVLIFSCDNPCSCCILLKIKKKREDDCVIKFLRGLNEEYSQVRSNILMMDPMPSITKTFSLIQQHEREIGGTSLLSPPTNSTTFATLTNASTKPSSFERAGSSNNRGGGSSNNRGGGCFGTGNGRGNRFCAKCKKTNHTIDSCFEIYGYPVGYRNKDKSNSTSKAFANLTTTDSDTASRFATPEGSSNQTQFTLSKEQYHAFLALIQHNKDVPHSMNHVQQNPKNSSPGTPFSSSLWVLDTGATDHICLSQHLFDSLNPIKPIPISLPNQTTILAKFSSIVRLGDLVFPNTFYVPHFAMHLISIPRFTSSDCLILFSDTNCHIVLKSTSKTIGVAKKKQGLFYLLDSIEHDLTASTLVDIHPFFNQCFSIINNNVHDTFHFTWTHLLKTKSEVKVILPSFISLIEKQFDVHLKRLCSDNGKEFYLHDFFQTQGILHETSCVERPQQNGIVERKHQHILNVCHALLFQAKLPKKKLVICC